MHVRFIKNIKIKVKQEDGSEKQQVFMFGECHSATQLEVVDEDYITILLKDGRVIEGLDKRVVENFGVPIVASSTTETITQETEEIENAVEPEEGSVPLNGTMLGLDGDEE